MPIVPNWVVLAKSVKINEAGWGTIRDVTV